MLAALQHVRKQTRAPNDSNKPGRRLPLRLRPAGTRGRAAACSGAGHGGEARGCGKRRGRVPRAGRAVPAAAGRAPAPRGTPGTRGAPPGHARHPRDTLRPSGRAPRSRSSRAGRDPVGSVRCPALRTAPVPSAPAPPPRPRARKSWHLLLSGLGAVKRRTPHRSLNSRFKGVT